MATNPGASRRPFGNNGFDYQEWASGGFRFEEPDAGYLANGEVGNGAYRADDRPDHTSQRELPKLPEQEPDEMPQHGLDNIPHHGFDDEPQYKFDDVPSRLDIEGYGTGLFGGPSADLFGGHGIADDPAPEEIRPAPEPDPDPVVESGSLVRPYTRTGGRTRPDYDLAIEALVSTSDRGMERDAAALPEHRSICGLCVETRSVAEIAAHLRLPLGVVRVLIGDMASMGLVLIHQGGLVVGDRPSIEFLERVLSGLRRL
jgi:Protein of unknown function (DUF742)